MSLSSQNKEKKKLKYGISFSQFTNMKNIRKHEEHTSRKLIQIKWSNTIKVQTTDLAKYNPKTQVKIQTSTHPHTSKPTDPSVTMPQIPFFKPQQPKETQSLNQINKEEEKYSTTFDPTFYTRLASKLSPLLLWGYLSLGHGGILELQSFFMCPWWH